MAIASFVAALATLALATGAAAASAGTLANSPPAAATDRLARPLAAASLAPNQTGWTWPLDPQPRVLGPFDPPAEQWGRGHRGVDLSAAVGRPVLSPAGGRVSFAGTIAGRGVVVVAHEGGLRSTFEPVRHQAPVGTTVRAGDLVAVVDETAGHCAPATCLHWGVLRGDTYLDPLSLMTRRRIVLLPLE
ncbi:MAG: M23 family metallopeptidase [Intrasporangium sp.]|uniref:M23 family metallopeptidase n=1 Tax=Intrasporangium sp. TaxID=1925024 RepID=UPI0026487033|nr:M23 family metallopeptidase [Intrasporangium sp.]MDN5794993.1 M23 family metallopeptidase [Intrasporangium sp.]